VSDDTLCQLLIPDANSVDINNVRLEEELRHAIEVEIDRRVQVALQQYDQWVQGDRAGTLTKSILHDNHAATQLQHAIAVALGTKA
jgi:hypothetical protein